MERYFHFNRQVSLENLENVSWDIPEHNSNLALKCFELRKIPIGNLTIEDLRLLIGQELGLDFLIPLALETLEDNTFSQGDLYSGDLLDVVLKVRKPFWDKNLEYRNSIEAILKNTISELEEKLSTFQENIHSGQ